MNLRLILVACLFFQPILSHALTPDRGRPFGAGEILGFPGVDYFVGDLSHDLRVLDPLSARQPLGIWPAWNLTRLSPFASSSSALLFEGTACPLPGFDIAGILPTGAGTIEAHDFPASAWWGPEAAGGAIHLRAPLFDPDSPWIAGAWGGTPRQGGTQIRFPGYQGTLSAAYRMRDERDSDSPGAWTVMGRGRREWRGDTRLAGGALNARTQRGDHWTSLYGEVRSGVGPFNEWVVKTRLQAARADERTARQAGLEARYLFNVAGFVESQWAAGGDKTWVEEGTTKDSPARGFLQNSESFDALGIVMGDFALRADFETREEPRYAVASGLQGHYGAFGLFGSTERSRGWGGTSLQDRLGFRFTPGDPFDAGVFLSAGRSSPYGAYHGPGAFILGESAAYGIPLIHRIQVRLEARTILTSLVARRREGAAEVRIDSVSRTRWVGRLRTIEGALPVWEGAVEVGVGSGWVLESQFLRARALENEEIWTLGLRYGW